tara:strand:+ start:362 stop:733 length:372 start_codon:yes stop_codon:yes gene_type:complete
MSVDRLFRQLERRTERDLYRKTYSAAFKSQQSLTNNMGANLKASRWKKIAKEVFWFFTSVFLGFLLGYLLFELFSILIPTLKNDLVTYLSGHDANLYYLVSFICFLGVYVVRLIIWSLKYLAK